jgi:hypothetical protein
MKQIPDAVLYVPLCETDGSALVSKDAYGHAGAVTGALWTPRGRSFDGVDDVISYGPASILNISAKITLGIWVNFTELPAVYRGLIGKGYSYLIRFSPASSKVIFSLYLGGSFCGISDTVTPALNQWVHYTGTYDANGGSNNMKLYRNGILTAQGTFTGNIDSVADPLQIGFEARNGSYFKGLIGEARLYNKTLTPQEIMNIYLTTKWRYQ